MVNATERPSYVARALDRGCRMLGLVALVSAMCAALLFTAGCSKSPQNVSSSTASTATTDVMSAHMAGPPIEVRIPQSAIDAVPAPWDLTNPESTVRSYLAWVSYADRIGQSAVATPTMSAHEEVGVDSFIQYYLEKSRLMDQHLTSITFGTVSTGATSAVVPTREDWTYNYLSIAEGNAVVAGPYSASYDATYTVVKQANGGWVVDSVAAKPKGAVK